MGVEIVAQSAVGAEGWVQVRGRIVGVGKGGVAVTGPALRRGVDDEGVTGPQFGIQVGMEPEMEGRAFGGDAVQRGVAGGTHTLDHLGSVGFKACGQRRAVG